MMLYTRYTVFRVIPFAFLLLAGGCQRKTIPVTVPTPVTVEPFLLAKSPTDSLYSGLISPQHVHSFYSTVDFVPQWSRLSGLGDSLLRILREARTYGLEPSRYHLEAFEDSVLASRRREVLLTDAFLAFGHDLRFGNNYKSENSLADSLRFAALRKALSEGVMRSSLESLEPPFDGYRKLREALGRLERSGDEAGDHERILTVEANLDRWRREQDPFARRYVLVQIPSFMVYVIEDDKVLLASRIIVGEPETPTPELTSTITRVVTYPYWHVPRKIAVKEFLPAIQQNVGVLQQNNFEVIDRAGKILNPDSIDWLSFSADNFPVSLRQKEGPENALGVIKFEFKNPYAVFLHDTNARRLFRESSRAFSHGCIRMEQAETLAHYLVTGKIQGKSPRLTDLLTRQERHVIKLSAPIPIYIRYFTAEVREGELRIYRDLYNKVRIN